MAEARPAVLSQDMDRERLILEHVPLLKHIAGRLALDLSGGLEREDLVGFGMIGLICAADSWDAGRGLQFSTYAYPRIRGAILDELRRQDFLPRGRRERVRELERAIAELEQRDGRTPTPEALAEHLDVPLQDVDVILLSAKSAGQASLEDGLGGELRERLTDPRSRDPVGSAEWQEMRELLAQAVLELPEQEQTVINLYYAEELLLREISDVLGLTESRISQIHTRALYRLNRTMSNGLGRAA